MSPSDERLHFTVIWSVDHFSQNILNVGRWIYSPHFIADSLDGSKWGLRVQWTTEQLFRCSFRKYSEPLNVKVNYDLAILSSDGSVITSITEEAGPVRYGESDTCLEISGQDIFGTMKNKFLSKDTMTVRFRVWKIDFEGEMPLVFRPSVPVTCFLRTRCDVESYSILLKVENYSSCTHRLLYEPYLNMQPPIKAFFIREMDGVEKIRIEMDPVECHNIHHFHCKIFLIDAKGEESDYAENKFMFINSEERHGKVWDIFPFIERILLLENIHFPNDELKLRLEIAVFHGQPTSKMEGITHGPDKDHSVNPHINYLHSWEKESTLKGLIETAEKNILEEKKMADIQKSQERKLANLTYLMKSLHVDQQYTDTNIHAGDETFPAHRAVLSARSPVFRELFLRQMETGPIFPDVVWDSEECDIFPSDVDSETMKKLLLYAYTDDLDELSWEVAMKLYVAAKQFDMRELQQRCLLFLKANVCSGNVCDLLEFSNRENEEDLKTTSQTFILHNPEEVIASGEWGTFRLREPRLAVNLLQAICTSQMKNSE